MESINVDFDYLRNLRKTSVVRISNDGSEIRYKTMTEAAKLNSIYHGSISRCCSGQRKFAGGYKWAYDI